LASTLFYQNRLKNGVEVKDREPLAPQLAPLTFVNVQNGKTEKSSEGSYWNEQEFMAVKDWVRRLVEEYSIDLKSIGVISLCKFLIVFKVVISHPNFIYQSKAKSAKSEPS
jgi:superfamily I DNA and/or RNA helicase